MLTIKAAPIISLCVMRIAGLVCEFFQIEDT